MIPTATSPLAVVLLLVPAIVLPLLGVWEFRRFLRMVREGRPDARITAYTWTTAIQRILTLGFLAWWRVSGGELAPLRLVPEVAGKQWIAVGAGLALAAGAVIQMAAVLRRPEQLARLRDQAGELLAVGGGSLFVPMLVHAVIDLVNGPMPGRAATAPQSEEEPSAGASASFSRNS